MDLAEGVDKPPQSLAEERRALSDGARLHWFHWAILAASALLTLLAWDFSKTKIEEQNRQRFDREADQIIELVSERMGKYEDALWSGVAAIKANGGIDYPTWKTFADSLRLEEKYPGINGIGVIKNVGQSGLAEHIATERQDRPNYRVHPQHDRADRLPIVYIEPQATNAQAVGLDMAHETNRYSAALQARDSGKARITGPIVLVQDAGQTPGFLFYAPYYHEDSFAGLVYAPFVVSQLMAGTLEKDRRHVGIRLLDSGTVIYDEHRAGEADFDPEPLYVTRVSLPTYGRDWEFDLRSNAYFREASGSLQPQLILLGGILIDCLLLFLFVSLTRASKRSLQFADRMTEALNQKAQTLEKTNAELETFAYVASHDLKTPVRGISYLANYLEEDLESYLDSDEGANSEVTHNLKRLHAQVGRMERLIHSILDFSSVGRVDDAVERCDLETFLLELPEELGVRPDQLRVRSELPDFSTYRIRLERVLQNLIDNAFKYHHDPEGAEVTVTCRADAAYYVFEIADNGPGIDPKFHGRIFEAFQTLQTKDKVESSGVGLAIVKRIIEQLEGSIEVSSELGVGTCFTFYWPQCIDSETVAAAEMS